MDSLESLWLYIYSFVGSIVNLYNYCYLIPPASRACCDVHGELGGVFPKRHPRGGDFGASQVVSEPRFCRYPRVQSACRITLPTDVIVSSVKTILLKMCWIDLSSSEFFSLPSMLSPLTFTSFESPFLPSSSICRFYVGG
jgi:hypothetical protein